MVIDSIAVEISNSVTSGPVLDREKKDTATTDFDLLHRCLEDERERLIERLETERLAIGQRQDGNGHKSEDEAATESLESWKRLLLEKQLREQIAEVERAMRKFEEGTYGLCDACGLPIAPERLEALPWATLCFNCKTRTGRNRKR